MTEVALMADARRASIGKSTRNSVLVMICTSASRLLGFVRVAVIGAVFGDSGMADVLNAAFFIPNNLRKLLAEGALSSAFIPTLSSALVVDPSLERARRLSRSLITFLWLLAVPLTAVCALFARPIVSLILAFPQLEKINQTASLLRWVFGYVGLISISAVLMAVLNSHGVFVVPALAPPVFSVCVIGSILILHDTLGGYSLAVGVLSGGLAQILFQLPRYKSLGYDFKPSFDFKGEDFRKTMRMWFPVVGSASVLALNQQFALFFASGLEDGSTTALNNAIVFWQLPFGIFSASVLTVFFPKMSREAAENRTEELVHSMSYGLRFMFGLLIPAAVILVLLGDRIINVALQRGAFSARGTLMASRVLVGYALGLYSVGAFGFLQRLFYALKDYRTPLLVTAGVCLVDVALSVWLKGTALRVAGLAVANSVAFSLGYVVLLFCVRQRLGALHGRQLVANYAKVTVSMIPVCAFLIIFRSLTSNLWTPDSSLVNLALVMAAGVCCLGLTAVMYVLLRVEITAYLKLIRRGLSKEER